MRECRKMTANKNYPTNHDQEGINHSRKKKPSLISNLNASYLLQCHHVSSMATSILLLFHHRPLSLRYSSISLFLTFSFPLPTKLAPLSLLQTPKQEPYTPPQSKKGQASVMLLDLCRGTWITPAIPFLQPLPLPPPQTYAPSSRWC
jgi:hypothetical protein